MATIHASAVLVGARAILIRGPSGAGKSRLALELIEAPRRGRLRFARLVGDDRVHVEAAGGRLLVRPAPALTGLIELRGLSILRRDYEACAVAGLVVDLDAEDAERLPGRREAVIEGVALPRLPVAQGVPALPAVVALIGLLGVGGAASAATGPAMGLLDPDREPQLGID
jgi:HPr kinase/phosphorylase